MEKLLEKKYRQLKSILGNYHRPAIAYSGGVDSALLLAVTRQICPDVQAIIADGIMLPRSEFKEAKALTDDLDAALTVVPVNILENTDIRENGDRRCYFCKRFIFTQIKEVAKKLECDVIFDGTNTDDLKDYRPGIKALEELSVVSPFVKAGMSKADIRELSRIFRLPTAEKPAMACLATRLPAGEWLSEEKLRKIEAGEEILKQLGLNQYRLRLINNENGRIECYPAEFEKILKSREQLLDKFYDIGFRTVTLDLAGYKQGKMNLPK